MESPDRAVRAHRHLRRYVLTSERVTLATRLHWSSLLEPVVTTVAATVLAGWLHSITGTGWVWLLWTVPAGRLLLKFAEWNYEWFVATDKRLILTYGFVIHKVAMMPLAKVTDMGYSRTPVGQLLGYGRFVMESAGQDQALRQIDYVPDPDAAYRTLCDTMFVPAAPPRTPTPPSPPPAIFPPTHGGDARRPTTAELPVVGGPGTGGPTPPPRPTDHDDDRPAPTPPPPSGGSFPGGGSGAAPSGGPRRRPWWRGSDRRSPYTPPTSAGAGPHVPDPFL
ncbi:PH (Pleckstrin Homology) domain-containing protein [Isoptericola jiangsuensis]|uniref:PH (Pleckstrin Homology) domain-containing protein n=1 Tax=Isoptericola jiangsuensis TaxID=548579 RepID=A0A2A9EZY0_9MICO|nr:PH domain-containing protein [Isoptericola jiangsuensis]PFG43810.1 PH (Pleckstrin Homology) domain-containing protein [Isoptericola jiangsuensis]